MGSKGSQTQTTQAQNQSQSYYANPAIAQSAGTALGMANTAAATPFSMPVAPVAGFSPLQQQAFNQYQALQGQAQPYYNTAQNLYNQSAAPITGADVSQYYNPMADNITAQMKNIFGQQNQQNTANLVQSAGGVGADRIAVGQANMANQQGLAAGQTYANLYQQALAAAQAQKAASAGAASGIAGLGTASQNAALQGTAALYGAGTSQQQQSQAELNAPYQNTLARLAYPFQTAQYLAGVTGGLAPALGGTTIGGANTVTTPPSPNIWSQVLGAGTAGAGLIGATGGFGSNGWLNNTFGSSPAYGGGNAMTDEWGGSSANPAPGLNASDYGVGFADGGEVDEDNALVSDKPMLGGTNSIVPTMNLTPGAGHSGPLTGALPQQTPQQQSNSGSGSGSSFGIGDVIKTAASIIPFLNKGGRIPGYDDGGSTIDDPSWGGWGAPPLPATIADAYPKPDPEMYGPSSDDMDHPAIRPGSIADKVRNYFTPSASAGPLLTERSPQGMGQQPPFPYPNAGWMPGVRPNARPSQGIPRPAARAAGPAAAPTPADTTTAAGNSALPYPDATSRDWGQNAARSPWMSLVQAGATMMATPGSVGTAIGKGLQAGTQELQTQRKALSGEEEINQKAKKLYQDAQQHLDKYTKMTPYERASVAARNRELDQAEESGGTKPVKFTGADYDRVAKWVQSTNPGLDATQLQPLIDAEVSRRRRALSVGAANPTSVNPTDIVTSAKKAIAGGANADDVIKAAKGKYGVDLTPDMLQ